MYLERTSPKHIAKAIAGMKPSEDDVVLVFLAEKTAPDLQDLVARLSKQRVTFVGGVFPAVIQGCTTYEEGAIIEVFPAVEKPFVTSGLDTGVFDVPPLQEHVAGSAEREFTAFILVDGWASHISPYLSEVYSHLGDSVHYFGGGAGYLSTRHSPCIFCQEGVFRDAAICVLSRSKSILGVRHGWQRLTGPLVATKTYRNLIIELNWRNALEVYKDTIGGDLGRTPTTDEFFSVGRHYPFGMYRQASEDVVREPLDVTEKGEIVCGGAVPENTVLNIMKGEPELLIEAAGQAAEDCASCPGGTRCLVMDCVSRWLYLGKDFDRELDAIAKKLGEQGRSKEVQGALSLGEISSYGEGYLEFFNKTVVVGCFSD